MDLSLQNRIAIVTGGSKGIGFGIARALVSEGCRVCLVARRADDLSGAAKELSGGPGAVMTVQGDVSVASSAETIVQQVVREWGKVDILINNAAGPPPGSFLEHADVVWQQALEQNFMSVVRFVRAVVPGMKERGWGRIVSITSTIAKEPTPQMVLSASARAAVSAFTKAIASELAPSNVTVNVVCPGGVQTERLESLMQATATRENKTFEEIRKRSVASIPMQRFASAAEVADLVAFLVSERANYLTGMSLVADGGLTRGVY